MANDLSGGEWVHAPDERRARRSTNLLPLLVTAALLIPLLLTQCSTTEAPSTSATTANIPAQGASVAKTPLGFVGTGTTGFTPQVGPHPGVPIDVAYHAPDSGLHTAPILIVLTGNRRDIEAYRDSWQDEAQRAGALLLVQQFAKDTYSNADYNRGSLVDADGEPNSPDAWSFAVIEALYDWAAARVASETFGYYLYGHSAGAQVVHRFMIYMPEHRVIQAVAANAGWYTATDPDIGFPYGLDGGPPIDIERALAEPLNLMAGNNDDNPGAGGLRQTDGANAQGSNRFERALHFYSEAKTAADVNGVDLGWSLHTVPGVEHSNEEMAPAAARILFGP